MTFDSGLALRRKYRGLIGITPKIPIRDSATLSLVYTPGVARPCLEIAENHLASFDVTMRGNTVAVISDGSSVYGLGDVGPYAAIPMLEAKSVFHKTFAGIDAFPISLNTSDVDEMVDIIRHLSPTFGGIHLEDIASPRCFALSDRLKRSIALPILHSDQEATAVGIYAAMLNALRVVGKSLGDIRIVISGSGTTGIAAARLFHRWGVGDIKVCDSYGLLSYQRLESINWVKAEIARMTNPKHLKGSLADVVRGADVFIGLSRVGVVTPEMIASMAPNPIVFALSLAENELNYTEAKAAGAAVVATGHSQWPNQINSSLIYPGIFRGALDTHAQGLNAEMFQAAGEAYAGLVTDSELGPDHILPKPLDFRATAKIAQAVANSAMATGEAQKDVSPTFVEDRVMRYVYEGPSAWVEPVKPNTVYASLDDEALDLHRRYQGVMEVSAHIPVRDEHIYNLLYSASQAAEPCRLIRENVDLLYELTLKKNLVGIVTDGSAILGLGNIGPQAGMPVMEGKAVLFKTFGGVEAFPICLRTQDVDELVETIIAIAPVFGGFNLEDIAAPRCFDVEQRLTEALDIPVFHDDQHGTAVVVLAGMLNAVRVVGKSLSDIKLVVNGAGASALSVSKLLMKAGLKDVIICDTKGAIYKGRTEGMNPYKTQIAEVSNLSGKRGKLADVLADADAFLGLSAPGQLTQPMIKTMLPDPIIFALANPVPEILPHEAYAAGAKVVATGRSDFPNQVNNSLAFPGIFRGALDTRARRITDDMKIAAAFAIADLISEKEREEGTIIPGALDFRVPPAVAAAVAKSATETGVARQPREHDEVYQHLKQYIYEGHLSPALV